MFDVSTQNPEPKTQNSRRISAERLKFEVKT
jgi:hypothetical protein